MKSPVSNPPFVKVEAVTDEQQIVAPNNPKLVSSVSVNLQRVMDFDSAQTAT